jgi:hypothetical protein
VTTPSPGTDVLGIHAEVGAAVLLEHVPLFEAVVVEQQFDALARGELALAVLRVDALWPPPRRASSRFSRAGE